MPLDTCPIIIPNSMNVGYHRKQVFRFVWHQLGRISEATLRVTAVSEQPAEVRFGHQSQIMTLKCIVCVQSVGAFPAIRNQARIDIVSAAPRADIAVEFMLPYTKAHRLVRVAAKTLCR